MSSSSRDTVFIRVLNKERELVQTIEARRGALLWVLLRKKHLPVGAACSGVGVCGACDVFIESSGAFEGATVRESEVLDRNRKQAGSRLSCLVRVWADMTVWSDRF
jgi:ferredoxin